MARIRREAIRHIYSVEDARELDRKAIEEQGIAGILLMKRAGRSALEAFEEMWPGAKTIEVFCGSGNNAGDGYIFAGLAADQGFQVAVWELKKPDQLSGDAALAREFAVQTSATLQSFENYAPIAETDVLVDALLGTGFSGSLRDSVAAAIAEINRRNLPVLSLDVPSGLDADTGWVTESAVHADLTISFIVLKKGLLTGLAGDYVGNLVLDDLDLGQKINDAVKAPVELMGELDLLPLRNRRPRSAHKGDFGTVIVIGGDLGFGGAAIMSAETALISGAGRVVLATRSQHVSAALSRCPEIMARGIERPNDIKSLLQGASALVIGPGLGDSSWSRQLLNFAVGADLPTVLDADALNLLAEDDTVAPSLHSKFLLTPHPGEAARLLRVSTEEIQRDRYEALRELQSRYPGTFVLKGAGTLVGTGGGVPGLCDLGNPGMATAGMGDVLSGLCGALLARGYSTDIAARAAVLAHSAAADHCTKLAGEIGLKATDLFGPIRDVLNGEQLRA